MAVFLKNRFMHKERTNSTFFLKHSTSLITLNDEEKFNAHLEAPFSLYLENNRPRPWFKERRLSTFKPGTPGDPGVKFKRTATPLPLSCPSVSETREPKPPNNNEKEQTRNFLGEKLKGNEWEKQQEFDPIVQPNARFLHFEAPVINSSLKKVPQYTLKNDIPQPDARTSRKIKTVGEKDEEVSNFPSRHQQLNLTKSDPVFAASEVRDRSKVGLRSSLPFVIRSSGNSAASSGSSDTQSQGSGGIDSKSDSLTPEGRRKDTSSSSVQSISSNGVSGGVHCKNKAHELSKTSGERETFALRQEVETLRAEITKARQTILHMQEREKKLKDRLGEQATRGAAERAFHTSRIENLSLGDRRPSALVRRYAHLYDQTRLDALDALDALPDLRQADELKAKILFSVVVLAFRSVTTASCLLREEVRRTLQMIPPLPGTNGSHDVATLTEGSDSHSRALELAISTYLAYNIDNHDLTKNVDEVCEQIWATLYDYPCLKTSEALLQYAKACVRVAWGLVNQSPSYLLEYEVRGFRDDLHIRFHTSNPNQDTIKTYLWPALLEGPGGQCVHQAVVIT